MRRNEVSIQPALDFPPIVFGHQGAFTGSPDWWRRFEYSEDQRRHVHYQEDLWTPGTFELELEPEVPNYLVVALGALPAGTPPERMEEAEVELRALDPGPAHSQIVRALSVSAEQFRVSRGPRRAILAGYPWLGVSARDTLLSLRGLYYCHGLIEDAKAVLRTLISESVDDLLMATLPESSSPSREPSVDASLWLFEAARELGEQLPPGDPFVREELYPVLCRIFERIQERPERLVWVTEEGLLATRDEATGLTWMDSRTKVKPVTPRWGFAVELQALLARAADTLSSLALAQGDEALHERARGIRDATRAAFRRCFWCKETSYPYDCIDERSGQPDPAVRPNALLALAVDPDLFESWQARAILARVKERLLTPFGIRSLDPEHPDYIGYYEGGMDSLQAAYHQGVAWFYLLGFYARAALRLDPGDFEVQMELKDLLEQAAQAGPVLGQVPQVSSGDPPQRTGGCPAQAWSVAELLATLWNELSL